jgi:hypothetical protein
MSHILKDHGRDTYLLFPATQTYSYAAQKMRFFAAFRAVIIVMMLMISLYSCTVASMTQATAGNEITSTKLTSPNNSIFYHPLIYQVAMSQTPDHLVRADGSKLEKLPQQTMLLLQVSFNSFYLLFIVILIMLCLALLKDRNLSLKRLLPRRIALQ